MRLPNTIRLGGLLPTLLLALMAAPASAQMDLVGEWSPQFHEEQPERLGGPPIGDYAGLPINEAARQAAESWDAGILSVPEHQCKPHPADYSPRGPANMRLWKEVDPVTGDVIAFRTHIQWQAPERWIYMDGRPHPDEYAAHTWQGFSTGEWLGPILKVTTTHLKKGWIRRNGLPRSDRAELTEYFYRHGDYLTWTVIIDDPVYLEEPMIRTTDFAWAPAQNVGIYPCEIVSEVDQPHGWVPHWLPGENPWLSEFAAERRVPVDAMEGGPETMLPEYRPGVIAYQRAQPVPVETDAETDPE